MRKALVILLLASLTVAAEPPALAGFAWYLPYQQLLRVRYRVPRDLENKVADTTLHFRLDRDGATVVDRTWPGGPTGDFQVPGPLAAGTYTATMTLSGGDTTVATAANDVVVAAYAFEHNGIGGERIVVPPFTPVTANGNTASVWGRTFRFGANGLPESIVVLDREILGAGGVRVVLRTPAGEVDLRGAGFTLATADGYDAMGTVAGTLGDLSATLSGRLEYDGCYFITLTVDAGEREVPVDSLTLEIPYAQADTYSFQKNDRDLNTAGGYGRFGGIGPGDDGVIFDARRLPSFSAYGVPCENFFVPAIYVGTGSRGLWYYADDDWDWYLNPANEHATLERVDGHVRLRVLLVNDHVVWRGRRTFEFVLMPQPVKPMAENWRRVAWDWPEPQYLHDTAGWRYYGDGVNAFTLPTPADYETLAEVFRGDRPKPKHVHGGGPRRAADDHRPLVLYGSSLMAGSGPANGEWATYAGDWTDGRWPHVESVRDRFGDKVSYGGFPWDRDVSLHPTSVNWSDSWVDFAVHYQRQLIGIAKVSGTWFDNQSCFTIPAWTAEGLDRHLVENPQRFATGVALAERPRNYGRRYHILQFRRYLRRLVTVNHQEGVPPFWLVNQHPTWSFAQMAWHIEADYYPTRDERDLVEHLGVQGFRAHVRTQGGLIARLHSHVHRSDQPPREGHDDRFGVRLDDATAYHLRGAADTHFGLCLLHDIGMIGAPRLRVQHLADGFDFFAPDVQFLPYWEQDLVQVRGDRVYASVYVHPATQHILVVLFNEKKGARGLVVDLKLAPGIGPFTDLETGEPIADRVYVPPRDVRLLVGRR